MLATALSSFIETGVICSASSILVSSKYRRIDYHLLRLNLSTLWVLSERRDAKSAAPLGQSLRPQSL